MRFRTLVGLAAVAPAMLGAQQMDSTSSAAPSAMSDSSSDQASPPQFSGTVFSNYMYQTGKQTGAFGGGRNSFNFERAYLTLKEQLSSRTSVRVTTDIFSNLNNGTNGNVGYDVRLKYGYLQYNYIQGDDWNAAARIGMLHTVYIDHEENFWPRWIAKTPTEIAGFFASADLGAATVITIPNKMGELYAAVTNGPGYTVTTDPDRFKDYQARLSLTPFSSASGILSTFDLSGWYYKGETANTVGNTPSGLNKDRWGIFAGIRDPRLTVGFDFAERKDGLATSATATTDTTGRVISGYVVARPMQWMNSSSTSPLGLVLRYDQIKPNTDSTQNYALWIAGLTWDLSKKAAVSLDYQEMDQRNGAPAAAFFAAPKAVYMHVVVNY